MICTIKKTLSILRYLNPYPISCSRLYILKFLWRHLAQCCLGNIFFKNHFPVLTHPGKQVIASKSEVNLTAAYCVDICWHPTHDIKFQRNMLNESYSHGYFYWGFQGKHAGWASTDSVTVQEYNPWYCGNRLSCFGGLGNLL